MVDAISQMERDVTRRNVVWLKAEFPDLLCWLQSISRFGKVEDFCIISTSDEDHASIKIATSRYIYNISAVLPNDKQENGYLGCTACTRKPRFGETWNRGNDLHDGPYTIETWNGIVGDIISRELEKSVFAE